MCSVEKVFVWSLLLSLALLLSPTPGSSAAAVVEPVRAPRLHASGYGDVLEEERQRGGGTGSGPASSGVGGNHSLPAYPGASTRSPTGSNGAIFRCTCHARVSVKVRPWYTRNLHNNKNTPTTTTTTTTLYRQASSLPRGTGITACGEPAPIRHTAHNRTLTFMAWSSS